MNQSLIILSFVGLLLTAACAAQGKKGNEKVVPCEKCSMDILSYTSVNKSNLREGDINSFLCTLDGKCSINAEFSEESNELLFYVFHQYPDVCLKLVSERNTAQKDFIIDQLSNPISDIIDVKVVIRSVEEVKGYDEIKSAVLGSLKRSSTN